MAIIQYFIEKLIKWTMNEVRPIANPFAINLLYCILTILSVLLCRPINMLKSDGVFKNVWN